MKLKLTLAAVGAVLIAAGVLIACEATDPGPPMAPGPVASVSNPGSNLGSPGWGDFVFGSDEWRRHLVRLTEAARDRHLAKLASRNIPEEMMISARQRWEARLDEVRTAPADHFSAEALKQRATLQAIQIDKRLREHGYNLEADRIKQKFEDAMSQMSEGLQH